LEWRLGDSLGISDRGTKAKNITSSDNAFVTNIVLARDPAVKRLIGRPQESAQPERKSTPRYDDEPSNYLKMINLNSRY